MGKFEALLLIGLITMLPLAGNNVLAQYDTTSDARIEASFDKMDTDKDCKISRAEYLAYNQRVAEARFTWIDSDGNGFATRTELHEGVRDLMGKVEHKWSKKGIPQ